MSGPLDRVAAALEADVAELRRRLEALEAKRPSTEPQAAGAASLRLADRLALRPRECAAVLGVSDRTLRELAPELPRIVRGGVVLYPVEAVREWLRREAEAEGSRIDRAVGVALQALSE